MLFVTKKVTKRPLCVEEKCSQSQCSPYVLYGLEMTGYVGINRKKEVDI